MLEVNDLNFEEVILKSDKPAIVDFYANWCGPCKMIASYLTDLEKEYEGKAIMAKVNIDDCSKMTLKYGIKNIPTVLFIKDGEVVDKQVGVAQKNVFKLKLESLLKNDSNN